MALILEQAGHTYSAGTGFAVRALSDVDLEVETGALVTVLGPTGSGKSTLLLLAAGLISPTQGRVMLDGSEVTGPVAGRPDGVGLVFQAPETQLFAETVLEDVAFGPRNLGLTHAEARQRAEEALAKVGLDPADFGDRSPFGLSGGEARRVALAGVLAMRPRYLLLDEPTAGLDANGREALLAVIDAVRDSTGIAVVTHDAEEFLGRADHVLVLGDGAPVFRGTVDEVVSDPSIFERSGLRAPEVLRVFELAARAGARFSDYSADPVRAAALLVASLDGGRGE